MTEPCPCDSGRTFDDCCAPVIADGAVTAEALMRSRYTAYVLMNEDYLLATWAPETRPARLNLDQNQKWLGLKVKRTEQGGPEDDQGLVEFVARYKVDGKGFRLHETSTFRKENGRWIYISGDHSSS